MAEERHFGKSLGAWLEAASDAIVSVFYPAGCRLCDRLLILSPGGRMAYFGPPDQALAYFNCADFPDLFTLLEHDTTTDWAARYRNSQFYENHLKPVAAPPRPPAPPPWAPPGWPTPPDRPAPQQGAFDQFAILCRRYLAAIAGDRQYLAFMLALPLVLSLFVHAVPGDAGLSVAQHSQQPRQLLVLFIIGGALMGCAASIREIVKEQAIYRREHAIGLSRGAYLASKLVILTLLTGLQGLTLGLLGGVGLPGPDESLLFPSARFEVAVAVATVSVVSMIVGLLISACIDNADRGMPLLVLVVMAQLILCGGLFAVSGRIPLEQLSWLSPSRWAYAMAAATTNVNAIAAPGTGDSLWDHDVGPWFGAFFVCVLLAVVLGALVFFVLRRLDPHLKARR